tara:strand:+ start:3954 stop:4871 length:918 start_codon:yes stop_codon:yes gene_type:complete
MKITETCLLEDRGIIYIEGPDAKGFLQNIITNNLDFVSDNKSIYSSILTPQGKYLFDFILIKHKKGYLIDCEKNELENLIKTLNLYKLRSKIEMLNLSNEFAIAAISYKKFQEIPEQKARYFSGGDNRGWTVKYREDSVVLDPRNRELGARLISNLEKLYLSLKKLNLTVVNQNIYYKKSFDIGIAQVNCLKLKNKLFGIECNFEELNAIDFKKGCFVGQENTSKIKLRSKLKRRLLPIKIEEGTVLENDLIKFGDSEIGRILIDRPFPFALIKIADPNIKKITETSLRCGQAKVKIEKPEWIKF